MPNTRSRYLVIKHPADTPWEVMGTQREVLEFRQNTDTLPVAATFQWNSGSIVAPAAGGSVNVPFTYSGTDPVVADFSENTPWLTIQSVNITQNGQSGELVVMLLQNTTGGGRMANITHTLPGTTTTTTRTINQNAITTQFNWTGPTEGVNTSNFESCGSTQILFFSWQGSSAPVYSNMLFSKPNWVTINGSTFTTTTAQGGTSGNGSVEVTAGEYVVNQTRFGDVVYTGTSQGANDIDIRLYQTGDANCDDGGGDIR